MPDRLSGLKRRQAAGYDAFIPHGLPPQPGIFIDAEMQIRLSEADRALGCVDIHRNQRTVAATVTMAR